MVLKMLGLKMIYEVKRKQPSARNTRGRNLYKTYDYGAAVAKVRHFVDTPSTVAGDIHLEAYIEISATKVLGLTPGYPATEECAEADPPPSEQDWKETHVHDYNEPMGYDRETKTFRPQCVCGEFEPKIGEQTSEPSP